MYKRKYLKSSLYIFKKKQLKETKIKLRSKNNLVKYY